MGLVKSRLTLTTPWTVACQAPLSIGFPRQGYWSGLPFPSPRHFPDPGINLWSPALQADSLQTDHQGNRDPKIWQPLPLGEAVEGELLPSIYDRKLSCFRPAKKVVDSKTDSAMWFECNLWLYQLQKLFSGAFWHIKYHLLH